MYKLNCEEFVCKLRDSCLYFDSCEKCKIEKCEICSISQHCIDYGKGKFNDCSIRNNN